MTRLEIPQNPQGENTENTNVKVLGLNVCGLKSKANNGIFEQYIKHYDIVCLSETKINPNVDIVSIPGYTCINMDRKKTCFKTGGIAILVKAEIREYVKILTENMSKCVLWVKYDNPLTNHKLIIGAVYIPPESSRHHKTETFDLISDEILCIKIKHKVPVCMLGDFNARTGNLSDVITAEEIDPNAIRTTGITVPDYVSTINQLELKERTINRNNSDKHTNNNGIKLIELCKMHDLFICNGRCGDDRDIGHFTCKNASVVDYSVMSAELFEYVANFEVDIFDPFLSDVHNPICLSLSLNSRHSMSLEEGNTPEIGGDESTADNVRVHWKQERSGDYKNAFDADLIALISQEINETTQSSVEHIDSLNNKITELLIAPATAVGICSNVKRKRKHRNKSKREIKPWFDDRCKELRTEYFKLKNLCRKERKINWKVVLRIKGKELRNYYRKCRTEYERNFHRKIRNLKRSNPKEYWKALNISKKNHATVGSVIGPQKFADYFETLSATTDYKKNNDALEPDKMFLQNNEILNASISIEELRNEVRKLKRNKSSGVDNIINEFLKTCPETVLILLRNYFNLIMDTGITPTQWSLGIIQPIYKNKGSTDDPNNYRGITLLSCLGKLFTAVLNSRLRTMLETEEQIGKEQAGFREGYSTLDHIYVLHTLITLYLSHKKRLYCTFVDFQKAFDLINRTKLWLKLIENGVNGKVMRVIHALYNNAKSCVKSEKCLSRVFESNVGVRQGENLSPLLFAIYINDLNQYLSTFYDGLKTIEDHAHRLFSDNNIDIFLKLYILLYADDTIIMTESPGDMQRAMDGMSQYCNTWDLTLNADKTKVVVFSKGKIRNRPKIYYNGTLLEVVDCYDYLGCTFKYNGSFQRAKLKQVTQAKKAMYSLLTKAAQLNLPIDIVSSLFDTLVNPILLYGSEIWGFENIQIIESVHTQFCKFILKLSKRTPNCAAYGELGRLGTKNTINKRMINFWCRILQGSRNKITYIVYQLAKVMHESQICTFPWIQYVKNLLNECGYANMWLEADENNTKWLQASMCLRIDDMAKQEWLQEVYNNGLCKTYRIIKDKFCSETYLNILTGKMRIDMCKFRAGNHRLPVNTGRYDNTPKENRICTLCETNDIGDEFHCVFVCPALNTYRNMYIKKYYYTRPNIIKMNMLFNTSNKRELVNLSKFINIILNKFQR